MSGADSRPAPRRAGTDGRPAPRRADPQARPTKSPLYPRLLRLRNVSPSGWQRAVLGEGAVFAATLLVLADVATAWTLLALPVAVAVVVKGHDLLAGLLREPDPPRLP